MPIQQYLRRRPPATAIVFASVVVFSGSIRTASGQELEPRAYAPLPTGLNFLVLVAGRSSGDVVVDPSLPIDDVQASVNSLSVGVGRTLDVFGRTALVVAALPYAWASVSGQVGEATGQVTRSGLADPRVKLSLHLLGGRARDAREFARAASPTVVGVSVGVAAPLGEYDRTKLINLGAHRWSVKPEIGISHRVRRWTIEGYTGAWLFTANDAFYTGSSLRTQRPVVTIQGHASYSLKPQLWVAVNGTWYSGGTTSIDGVERADLQRNSRLGLTLSLPVARQQSLKISASTGATTRTGADFKTIAAAWQVSWFD